MRGTMSVDEHFRRARVKRMQQISLEVGAVTIDLQAEHGVTFVALSDKME